MNSGDYLKVHNRSSLLRASQNLTSSRQVLLQWIKKEMLCSGAMRIGLQHRLAAADDCVKSPGLFAVSIQRKQLSGIVWRIG